MESGDIDWIAVAFNHQVGLIRNTSMSTKIWINSLVINVFETWKTNALTSSVSLFHKLVSPSSNKNVFKKTNSVGLKKEEKITQGLVLVHKSYTDDKKLRMPRISGKLYWPTVLESKSCLQIPSWRFIICVMTDRGRKNLQILSCTQSTCSSQLTR